MEACKHSVEYSRAIRERRSLLYTKLEPLPEEVSRARSSPGIQMAQLNQATERSRALAEETMEKINEFEMSLKKRPRLPSIGVTHSSSSTITEKPPTVSKREVEVVCLLGCLGHMG